MLEQKCEFGWHTDMLLDGVRMQVSFLKDLVTLKDPTSPYSFVNYLYERDRLEHFINLRTFYPTRQEYHDYFAWAATKLASYVTYGHTVEAVEPLVDESDRVMRVCVHYRNNDTGRTGSAVAANVSLSLGGSPVIPACVSADALGPTFHSTNFLTGVGAFHRAGNAHLYNFLVVGGGQSAAEAFLYLASEFPNAKVTLVHRGFSLLRMVLGEVRRLLKARGTLILEFSTEIERRPADGTGSKLERGMNYCFADACELLRDALAGDFDYELRD